MPRSMHTTTKQGQIGGGGANTQQNGKLCHLEHIFQDSNDELCFLQEKAKWAYGKCSASKNCLLVDMDLWDRQTHLFRIQRLTNTTCLHQIQRKTFSNAMYQIRRTCSSDHLPAHWQIIQVFKHLQKHKARNTATWNSSIIRIKRMIRRIKAVVSFLNICFKHMHTHTHTHKIPYAVIS